MGYRSVENSCGQAGLRGEEIVCRIWWERGKTGKRNGAREQHSIKCVQPCDHGGDRHLRHSNALKLLFVKSIANQVFYFCLYIYIFFTLFYRPCLILRVYRTNDISVRNH